MNRETWTPSGIDPEKSDAQGAKQAKETARLVEALMGRKAERRFEYIQKNAEFVVASTFKHALFHGPTPNNRTSPTVVLAYV